MNNKDSHEEIFRQILETKSFENLEQFTAENYWKSLSDSDKGLLVELLLQHGESLLDKGDNRVFEVFEKACQITPDDPLLYYYQGVILASAADSPLCFQKACECFATSTTLDPCNAEVWMFWAKTTLQQAEKLEDEALAVKAEALFTQAGECRPADPRLEAIFYWQWGMADSLLGRFHGEAVDFKKALKKFGIAASLGMDSSDFWEHYGHITCELGSLVNALEALDEGRKYFEKAVAANPENGSALISLAFCIQRRYEVHGQAEDFKEAYSSFLKAEPFNRNDASFWARWGVLLFLFGRQTFDVSMIEASFEKFKIAYTLEPDNPYALGKWAEAELLYGIYNERIDYLRQAEQRVISALKLQDNNPEYWYIYGTCLNEMGRYFTDISYYQQAIEKFQYGLYISPNDHLIAQGIAYSYFSMGELKYDVSLLELSLIYCEKAVVDAKNPMPQLWNDWGITLMKLAEITSTQSYLESAIEKFEHAIAHYNEDHPESFDPEWLYNYGCALDFLGDFHEDPHYYEKAIQMLNKFLQLDPTYVHAHYNIASAYSHLGELVGDVDCFHKAIDHFQKYLQEDNEDEMVWNDYGVTLLNLAELLQDPSLPNLSQVCFAQAEEKFFHAISLGNNNAYYNLACLYSLTNHIPHAIHYMEKAEKHHALPPLNEILDDEWLENLLKTPEFKHFLANNERKHHEK